MADDPTDNVVTLPYCDGDGSTTYNGPAPDGEDAAWHWQLAMQFVSQLPVDHGDATRILDHARELHRKYLAR